MRRENFKYYLDGLLEGDRNVLSRSISIIESQTKEDQQLAIQILSALPEAESIRIGVTGAPGVGKSTFIEAFGKTLVEDGHRLAVLAIDPSSLLAGGSILGDKTRMPDLSKRPDVFIRPSASQNYVGGTGAKTYQTMLLCEAAGYDRIIVETVGVGQTEVMVRQLVDFFLLLAQPASGDELQGIKKGIMEHVDGIVVNKADGRLLQEARRTQMELKEAMHYMSDNTEREVLTCSAKEQSGMVEVRDWLLSMINERKANGGFAERRMNQSSDILAQLMHSSIMDWIAASDQVKEQQQLKMNAMNNGELSPIEAWQKFGDWLKIQKPFD